MRQEQSNIEMPPERFLQETLGRRQLLKAIVATGGSVAMSSTLPEKWVKPVLEIGLLPAHAQGSPTQGSPTGALQVIAQWQDDVNLNLRVKEPDQTQVAPGNLESPTLVHQGDTTFQEIVKNKTANVVSSGVYQIFLDWPSTKVSLATEPDPQPVVIITTHTEGKNIGSIAIAKGDSLLVAQVTFPEGKIEILI